MNWSWTFLVLPRIVPTPSQKVFALTP